MSWKIISVYVMYSNVGLASPIAEKTRLCLCFPLHYQSSMIHPSPCPSADDFPGHPWEPGFNLPCASSWIILHCPSLP